MPPFINIPSLQNTPFIQGFFTRLGGVSRGDFASLNGSLDKGDAPENVMKNRRLIKVALGKETWPLITLKQTHSTQVIIVENKDAGASEGDALITTQKGFFLGILTADCAPVVLWSVDGPAVAAIVHAGWRGAMGGIIQNTVAKMSQMGAVAIQAAIGPCIWSQSYEVQDDFRQALPQQDHGFINQNKFDLPGYITHHLIKMGVKTIASSPANTYTDEKRFFSFRRKSHRQEFSMGCQLSIIGIS